MMLSQTESLRNTELDCAYLIPVPRPSMKVEAGDVVTV